MSEEKKTPFNLSYESDGIMKKKEKKDKDKEAFEKGGMFFNTTQNSE